jgi:hypothetical protein
MLLFVEQSVLAKIAELCLSLSDAWKACLLGPFSPRRCQEAPRLIAKT